MHPFMLDDLARDRMQSLRESAEARRERADVRRRHGAIRRHSGWLAAALVRMLHPSARSGARDGQGAPEPGGLAAGTGGGMLAQWSDAASGH
jgi:hypothetical protein